MNERWIPEHDAEIKAAWLNGDSSGVIAERYPGRTRNAVIGRLARLGLMGTKRPRSQRSQKIIYIRKRTAKMPSPAKPKPAITIVGNGVVMRAAPVLAQPAPPLQVTLIAETSLRLTLLELTSRTCKFPTHEEGGSHVFCGHAVKPGSVYCAGHSALTYNGAPKPQKPPAEYTRRRVAA